MRRADALLGARVAFVGVTVGFAWWGFRGRWPEIGDAVAALGPFRLATACGCALAGLALTGLLWRLLLAALGSPVPARQASAVFFVGQLGKYVPGSVWSFAAQAHLGRRHGVPVRSSVTASALFLLVHTATGLVVGGLLGAAGVVGDRVAPGWWVLGAAAGALVLVPPVVRLLGDRLAGRGTRTRFSGSDLGRSLALMAGVWASYGVSLWALLPRGVATDLPTAVAAFALAHAAGVLLVVAPAGLGAREAVLVALLAPAVGLPAAAAAALLSRAAHSLADFTIAGLAAARARRSRAGEAVGAAEA